jgi:hypothetical protein
MQCRGVMILSSQNVDYLLRLAVLTLINITLLNKRKRQIQREEKGKTVSIVRGRKHILTTT